MAKPLVVVIVGNGLSIGLMHHMRLDRHCDLQRVVPCKPTVMMLPIDPRDPAECPLWSEKLFPALFKFERLTSGGDLDFQLYAQKFDAYVRTGEFSPDVVFRQPNQTPHFNWFNPNYQLRCYLWRWIYYHDQLLVRQISAHWYYEWLYITWWWREATRQLCGLARVCFVSYNYDCFLEQAVSSLGMRVKAHAEVVDRATLADPAILNILKPHGTMAHQCLLDPGPWPLEHNVVIRNATITGPVYRYEYPPKRFPGIPDLIPPGHTHPYSVSRYSNAHSAAKELVKGAAMIVTVGFSAKGVDRAPFTEICASANPGAHAVHIDLKGAQSNDAGQVLAGHFESYTFLDVHSDDRLGEFIDCARRLIA